MIKWIDNWLNRITMYRLVLYYLILLLGAAVVLCVLGVLSYSPLLLVFTIIFLTSVCWVTNTLFVRTFQVPANVESVYISALILALIVTPVATLHDLVFLGWVAVSAMASKYILAIGKKHLFNPVAFAVALTAITINQSASWWVGSAPMLPLVILGGVLIVRKLRRFDLVASFLLTSLLATLGFGFVSGSNLLTMLQNTALYSPLLFFAFVIITEPLTTPPTRRLQMIYGALVGFLFAPQLHLGSLYLTPEIAVLIGNVFSYIVSPKARLILNLAEKVRIAPDVYDFIFVPNKRLSFAPGQYMEWTLGHEKPDSRGNRRYFTLASSPTEPILRVGVKFYPHSSSFKNSMLSMTRHSEIVASQLAGDFVLPENPHQRCVFIAGGIGITPFRSMIKYLLDTQQTRPIVIFYANRKAADILYQDILDEAQRKLGIKTIYTLTDTHNIPPSWMGRVGHINARWIEEEVPFYGSSIFYLSGPNTMVTSFEAMLSKMNINKEQIKTDFFPGFA